MNSRDIPDRIAGVDQLDDLLSETTPGVLETVKQAKGDIIVLGVGGKMGPTLARMLRRAKDETHTDGAVIGIARFSTPGLREQLEAWGVRTIACDLLDQHEVQKLPNAPTVYYLPAMKFGATEDKALTWAMNTLLPSRMAERYAQSRIVALSTGNVYGLSPVAKGGSLEEDELHPDGEYAMSCLGRERAFEYHSKTAGTPVVSIRLNYACELRYGVLVDLARQVWRETPIALGMGHFNVIWQGDANAMIVQALDCAASPARVLNLTGPEVLSVRETCQTFAQIMGKTPQFIGQEAPNALISNAWRAVARFGEPRVRTKKLIEWVAGWVMRGGETLNKPTHFEVRDGAF